MSKILFVANSGPYVAQLVNAKKDTQSAQQKRKEQKYSPWHQMPHELASSSPSHVAPDAGGHVHFFHDWLDHRLRGSLVAADRYELERLKLICEDKLCRHVSTTNHGCRGLKEACVDFLKFPRNFKAVVASEGFDHLKNICPSILEELVANLAL
ncbi:hypothetical protein BRADI_4g13595v3 [Brachypodium distachyon]|uniref:BPM/SPOP BACK domain-containing protein n=1 Tax=Brachypodium distachyon TaxID=15368 RepID=A0A2K2CML7_BRADI|nr:hypothetical protein BRADI_4g13595v3 [Brachypodium distachyon]